MLVRHVQIWYLLQVLRARKLSLSEGENTEEGNAESTNSTDEITGADMNNNSWEQGHNETDLLDDVRGKEKNSTSEFDVDIDKAVPNTTIHIGGIVVREWRETALSCKRAQTSSALHLTFILGCRTGSPRVDSNLHPRIRWNVPHMVGISRASPNVNQMRK